LETQRAIVCHYIDCDELASESTGVASGNGTDGRPELQKAVDLSISGGHTLVVAKVDRLSRKTEDALGIYAKLDGRLIACDIHNLDKFTLTIFMAIADRERELISIRTKAALKAARARGVELGKPENLTPEARIKGADSNRRAAINGYRTVTGYAKVLREKDLSYDRIARLLNEEGHKTRTGKQFKAMTVYRMVERAPA
jgi:DNA invertase Pin-like site-specific DNA recombinase